jgi:hypothetical protein
MASLANVIDQLKMNAEMADDNAVNIATQLQSNSAQLGKMHESFTSMQNTLKAMVKVNEKVAAVTAKQLVENKFAAEETKEQNEKSEKLSQASANVTKTISAGVSFIRRNLKTILLGTLLTLGAFLALKYDAIIEKLGGDRGDLRNILTDPTKRAEFLNAAGQVLYETAVNAVATIIQRLPELIFNGVVRAFTFGGDVLRQLLTNVFGVDIERMNGIFGSFLTSLTTILGGMGLLGLTRRGRGLMGAAGRGIGTVAGTQAARSAGRYALKRIPIVGAAIGLGYAAQRLIQGDVTGAGMEAASGLASTIPGLGTAASIGLDAAIVGRDMQRANLEEQQLMQQQTGEGTAIINAPSVVNNSNASNSNVNMISPMLIGTDQTTGYQF